MLCHCALWLFWGEAQLFGQIFDCCIEIKRWMKSRLNVSILVATWKIKIINFQQVPWLIPFLGILITNYISCCFHFFLNSWLLDFTFLISTNYYILKFLVCVNGKKIRQFTLHWNIRYFRNKKKEYWNAKK